MNFKTKKDSETGKKFNAILERVEICQQATKELSEKLGFKEWYGGYHAAYGGISSVVFDKQPDKDIWKKVDKGYMPRVKHKDLCAMFHELPQVSDKELNAAVNFSSFFSRIGFSPNKGNWHLFIVPVDTLGSSNYEAPKDCIEITVSEYNSLKKANND